MKPLILAGALMILGGAAVHALPGIGQPGAQLPDRQIIQVDEERGPRCKGLEEELREMEANLAEGEALKKAGNLPKDEEEKLAKQKSDRDAIRAELEKPENKC